MTSARCGTDTGMNDMVGTSWDTLAWTAGARVGKNIAKGAKRPGEMPFKLSSMPFSYADLHPCLGPGDPLSPCPQNVVLPRLSAPQGHRKRPHAV